MNLRLPNQFYPTSTVWCDNPQATLLRHQQNVASFQYVPSHFPNSQKVHMYCRLLTCSHVMLSNDHKWVALSRVHHGRIVGKCCVGVQKLTLSIGNARFAQWALTVCSRLTCRLTLRNSPYAALSLCLLVVFLVLHATIDVPPLRHASVTSHLQWVHIPQIFLHLVFRRIRPTTRHTLAFFRSSSHAYADTHGWQTCIFPFIIGGFLSPCVILSVLCCFRRHFEIRSRFLNRVSALFAKKF